nr:MAG TPA: hypothetical protein [Caudoviricetes sp.]
MICNYINKYLVGHNTLRGDVVCFTVFIKIPATLRGVV